MQENFRKILYSKALAFHFHICYTVSVSIDTDTIYF